MFKKEHQSSCYALPSSLSSFWGTVFRVRGWGWGTAWEGVLGSLLSGLMPFWCVSAAVATSSLSWSLSDELEHSGIFSTTGDATLWPHRAPILAVLAESQSDASVKLMQEALYQFNQMSLICCWRLEFTLGEHWCTAMEKIRGGLLHYQTTTGVSGKKSQLQNCFYGYLVS